MPILPFCIHVEGVGGGGGGGGEDCESEGRLGVTYFGSNHNQIVEEFTGKHND